MTDNLTKKQKYLQNGLFAAAMAAVAVFLVWKCRFGFANMDESLYLAIPYRFWQGDGMFVDEWNLSSFSSFLMVPLMWVYMAVVGTTEGILLNFRYIYVAVQALVAVFVYIKLKRYSWLGAFAAAITFFMYAPFSIMALSYNSMGIQFMTVVTILLLTNDRGAKLPCIIAGALFAGAVLCCPYLVIGFALYSVLVLINTVKNNCFRLDVLDKKCWLWFTAGVVALAVIFLAFSLSRASVGEMLEALKWMLNDPQHESVPFTATVAKYIRGVLKCSSISVYIYAAFVLLALAVKFTDGKIDKTVFFCLGAVLTGLMMLPFVTTKMYINYTMFPVNIFALFCLCLTRNTVVKRLFCILWIPGAVYSFCIHMASNQGFYNISSVSTVCLMGSLVIVVLTGWELMDKSRINLLRVVTLCAVVAVLFMQIMCVFYTRHQQVFWESGRDKQTYLLTQGPEKGILASEHRAQPYEEFLLDTQHLRETDKPQSILYLAQDTWMYLASGDVRMATFSPWLPGADEEEMRNSMDRLYKYFEINSDNMPQTVYALAQHHSFAQEFAAKYGYTETQTQYGNYIYTQKQ